MTSLLHSPLAPAQVEITEALANAIAEASKLPAEDQNFLAFRIMEEITEEKKWSDSFARSQDMLTRMADEALAEMDRGETRPLEEIL